MLIKIIWSAGPNERFGSTAFAGSIGTSIPIQFDSGADNVYGRLLEVEVSSNGRTAEAIFEIGTGGPFAGLAFNVLREEYNQDTEHGFAFRTIHELKITEASLDWTP